MCVRERRGGACGTLLLRPADAVSGTHAHPHAAPGPRIQIANEAVYTSQASAAVTQQLPPRFNGCEDPLGALSKVGVVPRVAEPPVLMDGATCANYTILRKHCARSCAQCWRGTARGSCNQVSLPCTCRLQWGSFRAESPTVQSHQRASAAPSRACACPRVPALVRFCVCGCGVG